MAEAAEASRLLQQEDLMHTRDTQKKIFRHLKNLNESCSLQELLVFKTKTSTNVYGKANLLNEFFQSVSSPKFLFHIREIEPENLKLTNFNVRKKSLQNVLLT